MKLFHRIANADAHHRFIIAIAVAVLVFLSTTGHISPAAHVFASWDSFSISLLAMAWTTMVISNPQKVRKTARLQDSSRTAIFVFVIISACASLLALVLLLGSAKDMAKEKLAEHVVLSGVTLFSSWALVHTVFTLRYAHSYYLGQKAGGLDFPGTTTPDYTDFAYFSFVIGMTSQVSDVQISSSAIRRLALIHGVVSFAFNTIILALTINIISGLL